MKSAALGWTYFQTGIDDLFRTPALIWGPLFVTCADPDYYFSLAPIKKAFPDVRILATEPTVRSIRDSVQHKIAVWSPKLGDNGPKTLQDVVIPEVWSDQTLDLDGSVIDILNAQQPNRFSLWVPSLSTLLGGVQIVSGIHVWMADTPTAGERAAWIGSLDALLDRPLIDALPGHMTPGSDTGVAAIRFTRDYITEFEHALARTSDAATLISHMKERYPNLAMDFVLELGAEVCKGEATWP